MKSPFDIRLILLIFGLLQGLAGLRLIKVSIPAYKLRGESAFLECQYEMNRSPSTIQIRTRHNQNGNGMNYIDADTLGAERRIHRRVRSHGTYQYPRDFNQPNPYQHIQQQQQQQQQHHQRYQQYQPQHYYEQHQHNQRHYHEQQQQQEQHQQHQEESIQYQTPKSPYGHSVYRGSYLPSSFSGRVGASTFTGGSHMTQQRSRNAEHERDDSFDESSEDERYDGEEDDEDEQEPEKVEEEEEEEQGESLYAIKWYKDNEEFYRYVPKAKPPKTSYRVDGVRVIEEHSDDSRVLLRGLTLNSTGLYRCEISAEAPNFSSVQGEGRMDIVYLPRDGPHIKGQQFQYQIGETLNLNCTSGKSHPASHLQWFINDQAILDGRYLVPFNDTVHRHGLITSTLGLQLTVEARHFHNGAMRVKCLASISPVLWKGDNESVLKRRPGIIDNREAMLLVRSSGSSLHHCRFVSSLLLLTIIAVLTRFCQLLLHTALT